MSELLQDLWIGRGRHRAHRAVAEADIHQSGMGAFKSADVQQRNRRRAGQSSLIGSLAVSRFGG